MHGIAISILTMLAVIASMAAAPSATQPTVVREPQWTLKDRRTLFTDDRIARARENIAQYPSAKAVADGWIRLADEWVQWDDADLTGIIASAVVPRDWGISAGGKCPTCGNAIGDPNNKPGWIVDPRKPFKVTCPIDGSVFPTNDYQRYYRSGFTERIGWDTPFVDDGWGWTDPKTGEKQWFVAFANHWTMHGKLMPAMQALGRAYVLTGDKRYAHKAIIALHRYAEVYPEMDYAPQSRYGTMMRALGQDYPGKITNHIWETDLVTTLVEAYDACWDTIDDDIELHRFTDKTGPQIRAFIEANLLEDAIDAYFAGKIRGNFGMHQSTLAHLGIVRQYGDQDRWYDLLMNQSSPNYQHLGLDFALHNLLFRDGFSLEVSSHYNSLWVRKISEYADLLDKTGRRPFDSPKLRRLYDAVLAVVCARAHNPSIGDGGSVWGGIFPVDPAALHTAYRRYRDPRYLNFVTALYGPAKDGGFTTFESLFHPPTTTDHKATPTTHPAQRSRLLDGYGMGILNDPTDSTAASLFYGLSSSHGHFDRLHFELFASGHPMMPDLGYPDAMNEFVPGIYTWSKNTIAHNTVTVDASRQKGNVPGTVELFVDGPTARVIDVSGAGTYAQCDQYRRALVMIDAGAGQSYFVDIFNVSGGRQHDYSLHGPPGTFATMGGQWGDPEPGTLAGPDVAVGQLYDAPPAMTAPDYKGGYSAYTGSGFQHLYNVRRNQGGPTLVQWSHEKDPAAKLRIRILDQPGQELLLANARVSPVKHPEVLTYVIARRQGEKLSSRFVSVIEPFRSEPLIRSASIIRSVQGPAGSAAVKVVRSDGGSDAIFYRVTSASLPRQGGAISTDAHVLVIRRDASGAVTSRFAAGGSFVDTDGERLALTGRTGRLISVDPSRSEIRIKPEESSVDPSEFVGRVVHFRNELRKTAHPITAARPGEDGHIVLATADDLRVGRARVKRTDDNAVQTDTALPLAPIYRGVTLSDGRTYAPLARVDNVIRGAIHLTSQLPDSRRPAAGDDVWLVNVGPGDRFELPALLHR